MQSTTTTYKVQIIGEDGTFALPKTYTENTASQNPGLKDNYRIISIVGGQSSGKSTLLNAVFSTDFKVLDAQEGIKQTTKGIWGAMIPSDRVFVMDVEGVDSAERWEEGEVLDILREKHFLIFFGDVPPINHQHLDSCIDSCFPSIYIGKDVRRFSGSNLKLLQTIFEINFRLFYNREEDNSRESQKPINKKTLIIILRDFNPSYNLDKIKEAVISDIEKLWDEIKKPDQYKDSPHSDFFRIQFEAMPDYNFERDKFNAKTKELNQKFSRPTVENGYLEKQEDGKEAHKAPIPFESLDLYMKNIWSIIRSCKDLDVPTQKALISEYRCNTIKNDILKEITIPGFEALNKRLNNIYPDIKRDCEDLIDQTLLTFDSKASFYMEEAVNRCKQDLETVLKENLMKFLKRQVKLIRLYVSTQIEGRSRNLRDLFKKRPLNFSKAVEQEKGELLQETSEMLQQSNVEFLNYDMSSTIGEIEKEIRSKFDELFSLQLKQYTEDFFKNEMEKMLSERIASLFMNEKIIFWEEFNNFFYDLWKKVVRMYEEILKEGFGLAKKDYEKYILHLRNQVKTFVTDKIYERKGLFNQYIKEVFDYHFTIKDGVKRNWADHTEKDIQALYEKSMDFCARVIDSFKNLEILEHKIRSSQQMGSQDTLVIEDPDFSNLFTESECYNYKNMLGEYAKPMLEYAKSQSQRKTWLPNLLNTNVTLRIYTVW